MVHSAVPAWLQITWAIVSGLVLPIGGIGWVAYFVMKYLKPMKEMQKQALELAANSVGTVEEFKKSIEPLVEKTERILEQITPIVEKANGATDDVIQVAHKVREGMDAVNGSLDFEGIKEELRNASESLKTISSATKGLGPIMGMFGGRKDG